MVNNSERSKEWRNKRKSDPTFLENERKRKQESRKKRTEKQRERDKELCKARQRKYRQKKREFIARSGDTDDQISDSSDVTKSVLTGNAMDTDVVSSIVQSQDSVSLSSVSNAVNIRSSSKCGQSSKYYDKEHKSDGDNVVITLKVSDISGSVVLSDHDLQPNENGEDKNYLKPSNDVEALRNGEDKNSLKLLNDVEAKTCDMRKVEDRSYLKPLNSVATKAGDMENGEHNNTLKPFNDEEAESEGLGNQLQHLDFDTSFACGKFTSGIRVFQTQVSCDVIETADGNSSRFPSNILSDLNIVLHGEEKNRRAISVLSNSDSSLDDMEQQVGSASEQPNQSTSGTEIDQAGNVKSKTEDPIMSASETSTCMSGEVKGIFKQSIGHVFEADMDKVGNTEVRAEQSNVSASNSFLTGKKTTKWIQQYAEGENHEVVSLLTNDVTYPVVPQREAFFVRLQRELSEIADFDELKSRSGEVFREIERRYPIPAMQNLRLFGHQRDVTASSLYPQDAPRDHVPIQIVGDGNCLPRVGSLFAFGNDKRHHEIRVRIFIELCLFEDTYLNNSYLNRGLENDKQTKSTATLIAQYSDVFTKDVQGHDRDKYVYRVNTKNVLNPGSYNGMWSVFALASVIGVKVRSIYPDYGGHNVRADHNRMVIPRVSRNNDTVVHIMWTNTLGKQPLATAWTPNHFVAVVHKSVIDDTLFRDSSGTSEGQHLGQSPVFARTDAHETERNSDTCLSHPSEKPVYLCNTCRNRPICYKCPLEGHKNHKYADLELHLKKKENEYLTKALRKQTSVLQTELKRQQDSNKKSKESIAHEIDERVSFITEQLQKWRQQCHQKLEDNVQAIHKNIKLSGVRMSATIPTYLRNVQQQLRQLNMAERLARMSEDPPPDIAVNTNPCTRIHFTPGNDDHLIQQFGSISCNLPDPINTSAENSTMNVLESDNTCHHQEQSVQPRFPINQSMSTAIRRPDTEDMDSEITTSHDLTLSSRSIVESTASIDQWTHTTMGSTQYKPTPNKRPRVIQSVVFQTGPKQRLGTSPNGSAVNTRSCRAPIVSATNDGAKKNDQQCTNTESSILNTRVGPNMEDYTESVQQLARPNMLVSPDLTGHQTNVNPHLTCLQSSGIGSPLLPPSIKSYSEARVLVGQSIVTSTDPTGSSGKQSSDEYSTCVGRNQTPRTTQALVAGVIIPNDTITSHPWNTDKVTAATCLARTYHCGIIDSVVSQKVKSARPSRTIATTQKTIEKSVFGGGVAATESLINTKIADQRCTRELKEQTRNEYIMSSTNTVNELSPRADIAVKGACAINTTIVTGTTPTAKTNVEKTIERTDQLELTLKPDRKENIASAIYPTITDEVTSPTCVDELKPTARVGTASRKNINFAGTTNCTSAMATPARIPKTNMNVSGSTNKTSAEQMTNFKVTRRVKAEKATGTIRTANKHTTGAPNTILTIEGPGQINDTVETTQTVNGNISGIIKTTSVASPMTDNVNGTTNVANAVETAPMIANENTSGVIKTVAKTSPIAKSNVNGSTKIANAAETMSNPDINFTRKIKALRGAKRTSLINKVDEGTTKITNSKGTTLVVNNNVAGRFQELNLEIVSPASNIIADSTTKSTDAVGTIRNPYINFNGSTQATGAVEGNKNVGNVTKIVNSLERTPDNRNVNKTRPSSMFNTNVNGKTNITRLLETAPMVDKSDIRTIRSVNILRSTQVPKRKRQKSDTKRKEPR